MSKNKVLENMDIRTQKIKLRAIKNKFLSINKERIENKTPVKLNILINIRKIK